MDYSSLAPAFEKLDEGQLNEVHRMVSARLRHLQRLQEYGASTKFKVGDLIDFMDPQARLAIRARIERINTMTLACIELEGRRRKWRVSPSMCKLVGA